MAKRALGPIEAGRIRLRLLEEADLPLTLAWRNQDHIRRWFLHSDVISPEQHRAWWLQYRERDDDFVFVIEETQSLRRPVGQVSLYRIDWPSRSGEFGRLMIGDPEATGQGLAKEATARLLAEAATAWAVDRIRLEVRPDNLPAIAIYRQCGFTAKGTDSSGVVSMTLGGR